jgi:hypothetical protein
MESSRMQLGHDAHIPAALKGPLLLMSASPAIVGNIPTIFVGIVDDHYTDEMWRNHATRLANLFGITDQTCTAPIKVVSEPADSTVVDAGRLAQDITYAMQVINQLQTKTIRIVGMGIGSSLAVTEALESLIRGWEIPPEEKNVQFIALGESTHFHYLNLCKSIVMKQMCHQLQYYNTMDYNVFGYLRSDNLVSHLEAMAKQSRNSKQE